MSAKSNSASSSSCARGFDVSSRSPNFRRKRRALVVSAATWPALIWVGAAFAQAKKAPVVIGWLQFGSRDRTPRLLVEFKEGLAALGWKEGAQYVIEERWADGRIERLQAPYGS